MKVNNLENSIINNKRKYSDTSVSEFAAHKNTLQSLNSDGFSRSNNISFTAGMDPTACLIDFWAAIARGGLAASFTIQDMLGTNFPRTFAALDRNKDITGENNYKAALEAGIREFTTGPSMFVIPALVLTGAARLSGEANRVPVDNIAVFSDIMKGTISNLTENDFGKQNFSNLTKEQADEAALTIKRTFYNDVFKSIFEQYDNSANIDIDSYVDLMLKAENPDTPNRSFFKRMFNKRINIQGSEVDSKDEILTQIHNKFVADKKANTKEWGDFIATKVTASGKEWKIDDILTDMKNYSNDFSKQYIKIQKKNAKDSTKLLIDSFVENFKNMRTGSRFITNVLMVLATGLAMSFIPKLYTRSETNPETDAIYAQVNQQRKGAANANK